MSANAGWYRDPTGHHTIRYWDGQQWSDQANSGGANAIDPVPADVRYVQPAPGTQVQPAAPAAPAPAPLQVTQQSAPSSVGTVVAVVLSVVAVLLVLVVLLTQGGDDETDTSEPPVTTEAPAVTEAPSDG